MNEYSIFKVQKSEFFYEYQYSIKKLIKNQVKSSINGFNADFLSILLLDIGITISENK